MSAESELQARAAALQARVRAALGGEPRFVPQRDGMTTIALERDAWRESARRLREAGFRQATLVTGIDHYPRTPRFELVLQLVEVPSAQRVRLTCALDGPEPVAQSVVELFPGAAFMERECFDLLGIRFEGHAGLKRLMMPDAYRHHPLRKDFPHQGIEPDRLYREWDERRRAEARARAETSGRTDGAGARV